MDEPVGVLGVHRSLRAAAQRLWRRDLLAAADGNLSVRLDPQHVAVTGAGVHKAWLTADDVAVVRLDGTVLRGRPSTELDLHLRVYRTVPEASAVVHAHPPTAVGFTLAFPLAEQLDATCLPEVILAVGRVPIAPYGRPGTPALGDSVERLLAKHRVILLARHGALAWGATLSEAVGAIERVEHAAKMLAAARAFGGAVPLPEGELAVLRASFVERDGGAL